MNIDSTSSPQLFSTFCGKCGIHLGESTHILVVYCDECYRIQIRDSYDDGDYNGYNRGYDEGYDIGRVEGYTDGLSASEE